MMHGNRLAALAASGKRKMLMTVPWISLALGPWVRRIAFESIGTCGTCILGIGLSKYGYNSSM